MGDELTERIIGAVIEVHKPLVPGLLVSIHEEALCREAVWPPIRVERAFLPAVSATGDCALESPRYPNRAARQGRVPPCSVFMHQLLP